MEFFNRRNKLCSSLSSVRAKGDKNESYSEKYNILREEQGEVGN